ncbi:MAG: hypothetical protein U7123_25735 [Potamolinea sp.]
MAFSFLFTTQSKIPAIYANLQKLKLMMLIQLGRKEDLIVTQRQ